ncbi:c-type heme family protein [Thalassoglobus polymorphus]|uniref:Tll0287-like domain-containing protein n=1 Tax=Thalassoglobus polymorphus TaxID=2527994 RepID=A0A517QSJ4_9PLAN|nr:DUF3365 domain-containing protein [Thalassoglobus polymorphus]QDT34594.1 hypothetical protein Mal48_38570 [Thalassoglobus polymorphus]
MKYSLISGCVLALGIAVVAVGVADDKKSDKAGKKVTSAKSDSGEKKVRPAAVKRTRETVKMLDDIYKQTIVLVTDKYVHDEDDFAAGSAAVELFRRVSKTGFHDVRLIDLTGDPYEPENVAKNDFEKKAAKAIKSGEAYVEEVKFKDGKPYLQAMTAVPVVMERCIMCHAHYADVKKGEAIGAVSYELPIK